MIEYSENWFYEYLFFKLKMFSYTQLAFFINLQRAVIGPSATLTGR